MTRLLVRRDIVTKPFKVCNKNDVSRCETLSDLIVDTGSTISWIPKEILERIGVEATGRAELSTIKGEIIYRPIGDAFCELEGEKGNCPVIFAEKGDANVIGATALERFGLSLNMTKRKLEHTGYLAV